MAVSKSGFASFSALGVGIAQNGTQALQRGQTREMRPKWSRRRFRRPVPARNIAKS
jgi:hypothetical protein